VDLKLLRQSTFEGDSALALSAMGLTYDSEYTLTFHSPGIEPWITGLLKNFRPSNVLDVGCGLGFWGLVLKNYLGISKVVGIDVDVSKVEFCRKLGVYDEIYASDVRTFNYTDRFDAIIAVEAVHGILDLELLRKLESLVRKGGVIVLTLPSLPESMNVKVLVEMGYTVFRYFLRGFILVRIDKPEVYTIPSRLWRILGAFIRILHPVLNLGKLLRKGYLIAYKVV
jgi:SAM-dependent methyltransferase